MNSLKGAAAGTSRAESTQIPPKKKTANSFLNTNFVAEEAHKKSSF